MGLRVFLKISESGTWKKIEMWHLFLEGMKMRKVEIEKRKLKKNLKKKIRRKKFEKKI